MESLCSYPAITSESLEKLLRLEYCASGQPRSDQGKKADASEIAVPVCSNCKMSRTDLRHVRQQMHLPSRNAHNTQKSCGAVPYHIRIAMPYYGYGPHKVDGKAPIASLTWILHSPWTEGQALP